MDETVDCREGHGLIREDFSPFTEWLIGGDEDRSPLVAGAELSTGANRSENVAA